MKKFIIFLVLVIVVGFWAADYVKSGKLQNYIDANSSKEWAPKAQYHLGVWTYNAAYNDKAEYCFKHLMEKYPKSPYVVESLYHIGKIYEETNRLSEAREIYKKLLNEFPNYKKAELVRKKYNYLINIY